MVFTLSVILSGILQYPLYELGRPAAVNFGAIGSVIGHELTHGFDNTGRYFDKDGNLNNWWTEESAKKYEQRARCFLQQYSKFDKSADITVTKYKDILFNIHAKLQYFPISYFA